MEAGWRVGKFVRKPGNFRRKLIIVGNEFVVEGIFWKSGFLKKEEKDSFYTF